MSLPLGPSPLSILAASTLLVVLAGCGAPTSVPEADSSVPDPLRTNWEAVRATPCDEQVARDAITAAASQRQSTQVEALQTFVRSACPSATWQRDLARHAALALSDPAAWADAWASDCQTPGCLFDAALPREWAGAVLQRLAQQRGDAAGQFAAAYGNAAPPWPATVASALDLTLYGLVYRREYETATTLLTQTDGQFADGGVIAKHRVVLGLQSRAVGARSGFASLVGQDAAFATALATEFRARALPEAAAVAYELAATLAAPPGRSDLLIQAARAAWETGNRDSGRRLALRAIEEATDADATTLVVYRTAASARDEAWALVLLRERLDAAPCVDTNARFVAQGEMALLDAAVALRDDAPLTEALARVATRGTACPSGTLLLDAGLQLFSQGRFAEAAPLLDSWLTRAPTDAAAMRAWVVTLERLDRAQEAADAAAAWVELVLRQSASLDEIGAVAMLTVLEAGTAAPIEAVRYQLLQRMAAATPGSRSIAFALATTASARGDVTLRDATLDRWVQSAPEEVPARFDVARWRARQLPADPRTWEDLQTLLVLSSTNPHPAPPGANHAVDLRDAVLQLRIDVAIQTGPSAHVLETAQTWAAGDAATWARVVSRRTLVTALTPSDRQQLFSQAIAAGHDVPALRLELAEACLLDNLVAEAVAHLEAAVRRDLMLTERALELLARRGHLAEGRPIVQQWIAARGEDAVGLRSLAEVEMARAANTEDARASLGFLSTAHRAWQRYLAAGFSSQGISVVALRRAGLLEIAAAVGLQQLQDGERRGVAPADVALDLALLGAPVAQIDALLTPEVRAGIDISPRLRLIEALLGAGHVETATALVRAGVAQELTTERKLLDVERMLAALRPALAVPALRALVDELLLAPAAQLVDPAQPAPSPWATGTDRRAVAAALRAAAADTFYAAGDFEPAASAAAAAVASGDRRTVTLRVALRADRVATQRIDAVTWEALAGASGGTLDAWMTVAEEALAHGDRALAMRALEAAASWDSTSWQPHGQAALLHAEAGRGSEALLHLDQALRRVMVQDTPDAAAALARTLVPALEAAGAFGVVLHLLDSLADRYPSHSILAREQARIEVRYGHVGDARRRLDRAWEGRSITWEAVEDRLRAELPRDAVRVWTHDVGRLAVGERFDLLHRQGDRLAAWVPADAWIRLVAQTGSRGQSLLTAQVVAQELAAMGRLAEAVSWLAAEEEELDRVGWLWIVALQANLREMDGTREALERAAGSRFLRSNQPAVFDPDLALAAWQTAGGDPETLDAWLQPWSQRRDGTRFGAVEALAWRAFEQGQLDAAISLIGPTLANPMPDGDDPLVRDPGAAHAAREQVLRWMAANGWPREAAAIASDGQTAEDPFSSADELATVLAIQAEPERAAVLLANWNQTAGALPAMSLRLTEQLLQAGQTDAALLLLPGLLTVDEPALRERVLQLVVGLARVDERAAALLPGTLREDAPASQALRTQRAAGLYEGRRYDDSRAVLGPAADDDQQAAHGVLLLLLADESEQARRALSLALARSSTPTALALEVASRIVPQVDPGLASDLHAWLLARHPHHLGVALTRARLTEGLGRAEEGVADVRGTLAAHDDHPLAWHRALLALEAAPQTAAGLAALAPVDGPPAFHLAVASRMEAGADAGALARRLERATTDGADPVAHDVAVATVWLDQGHPTHALAVLSPHLVAVAQVPEVWRLAAQARAEAGDAAGALRDGLHWLSLAPRWTQGLPTLITTLATGGHEREAGLLADQLARVVVLDRLASPTETVVSGATAVLHALQDHPALAIHWLETRAPDLLTRPPHARIAGMVWDLARQRTNLASSQFPAFRALQRRWPEHEYAAIARAYERDAATALGGERVQAAVDTASRDVDAMYNVVARDPVARGRSALLLLALLDVSAAAGRSEDHRRQVREWLRLQAAAGRQDHAEYPALLQRYGSGTVVRTAPVAP